MMTATNPGGDKTGDPCSLLDTAEVSAAIGPLAVPPYRGKWKPDARASSCRYDTKDHRRIVLDVTWSGGGTAMRMVHMGRGLTDQVLHKGETKTGTTILQTGDTLTGDWDEIALMAMNCCIYEARRGDQLIEMDFTGTRLTPAAAGTLLNSAIKRLDHPLSIDGAAAIPQAMQLYATEAKDSALDVCSLLSQHDAEAILGVPLTG
jgi:hypothetical protein